MSGDDSAADKLPNETYDELAGVVDLFTALTRDELTRALDELAYKEGKGADVDTLESAVETAIERYYLVECEAEAVDDRSERDGRDADTTTYLAVGPVAFPMLPPNAEDLPHILAFEGRTVDGERLGDSVAEQLREDATAAIESGDDERIERLLDVSYDVEAWAPIEVEATRSRLAGALQDKSTERLG